MCSGARSAVARKSRALEVWLQMHAQETDALETEHGLEKARSALLNALAGHDEMQLITPPAHRNMAPQPGDVASGQGGSQHVTVSRKSGQQHQLPPLPAYRGSRPLTVAAPAAQYDEGALL